jgi:hypothetical protein
MFSFRMPSASGLADYRHLCRVLVREVSILCGITGVAVASMAVAGYMAERNVEAKEDASEPVLGRRIVLGDGRRIHVRVTETVLTGSPGRRSGQVDADDLTVVFEGGQGETLLNWEPVLRRMYAKLLCRQQQQQQQQQRRKQLGARKVRLISYSRSGLGLSDAVPWESLSQSNIKILLNIIRGIEPPYPPFMPSSTRPRLLAASTTDVRSSSIIAEELQEILQKLGTQGDVVMVAHGAGCLHARVFACAANMGSSGGSANDRFSSENFKVRGLILVEPTVEGTQAKHAALDKLFGVATTETRGGGAQDTQSRHSGVMDAQWPTVGVVSMREEACRDVAEVVVLGHLRQTLFAAAAAAAGAVRLRALSNSSAIAQAQVGAT